MAILSCDFLSACMGRTVSFRAIIPTMHFGQMFDPNAKPYSDVKPFKTLYLLHGIGGNDTDWLVGTSIAQYAEANNLAVIMPAGENGFYTDNNATHRYGEFLGRELIEATRAMFNLSDKREDTYVAGLSMGGYGAIRNGLKYSNMFSKIVALSSALVADDAPAATDESHWSFGKRDYFELVFGDLDKINGSDADICALADKNAKNVDIYLACGTEDFLIEKNRAFRDYLSKIGADFTYEEGPGIHDWAFWDTYIEKGINWIMGE
jgi:Predicted esterase